MPELVETYFDWLAGIYDETTAACQWSAPQWLGRAGGPLVRAGDWVLDLGAGTGQSSAPFLALGARCVGLDFAAAMLAQARAKYPALSLVRCDLDCPQGLPVADGRFALVVSAGVLECLSDPVGFVDRAWRALARGGHLVFTFDEFVAGHPVQGVAVGRADSGIDNPVADLAGWQLHRHTLAKVTEWLTARGFELLAERQIEADIHSHFQVPIYYRLVVARKAE